MAKMIICKGSQYQPAQWWKYVIIREEQYAEAENQGWQITECRDYLTPEQITDLETEEE